MCTSTDLAKKLNLEQYLDSPDELNQMIFNLMLLEETIQLEHARKKRKDHTAGTIAVKRIVCGKFIAGSIGDETYGYAVETALKASSQILPLIQRARFVQVLRAMGVPEEKIDEFRDTLTIDDDTHCVDQD